MKGLSANKDKKRASGKGKARKGNGEQSSNDDGEEQGNLSKLYFGNGGSDCFGDEIAARPLKNGSWEKNQ